MAHWLLIVESDVTGDEIETLGTFTDNDELIKWLNDNPKKLESYDNYPDDHDDTDKDR